VVCLKQKNADMALDFANQSLGNSPRWSKSKAHARKGQTLEALQRYDECVAAFTLAVTHCDDEKERKRYQEILEHAETLLSEQEAATESETETEPKV